jgi:Flp pilus assembly protein TadB
VTALAWASALLAAAAVGGARPSLVRLRRVNRLPGRQGQVTGLGDTGELALLADLLAAALAAGLPLVSALDAVDRALPGPRRYPLDRVRELARGGSVDDLRDGELPAVLVRALRRSGRSGSRLASQLGLLADDTRAEAAASALDRARRVGVLAVLPLGLCCLPAFMLLAVVPLAAGLLRGTLA